MKKLLSLLTLMIVAISASWAEDFEILPVTGSYNYTSMAKLIINTDEGTNLKISSGQIQTGSKNQSGQFTISATAPGTYVKSVSFVDGNAETANKLVTLTLVKSTGDGTLANNSTDASWNYTNGTTSRVSFTLTANSGGAGKLGTIKVVVSSTTNNIETLSGFSLSSGKYSFSTAVGGAAVTSTVALTTPTSSGGSVSGSNISLSSNRTITFTSERNIKYIAFSDSNCRAAFSVDAGGGTCDGGTWSAGATDTKTVTLKNAAGTTLSGLSKVFVITEAEGPKDGSFSISSSELEVGKTLKIQLGGDDEFEDYFTAGTLWESEAGGPYVSLSADGTITGVKATPDGYYFTFTANSQNTDKYNTTTGNRIDVAVVAAKIDTELSFGTPTTTVEKGSKVTNVASLTAGGEAIEGTVTYASDNTDVATVDASTGEVTAVAVGSAKITATFEGNNTYSPSSAEYTITIPLPTVSEKFWTSGAMLTTVGGGNTDISNSRIIDDLELVGTSTALRVSTGGNKTIDGQTFGGRIRLNKNGTAAGNYVHFKVAPNSQITVWGIRANSDSQTDGLAIAFGAVGEDEVVYSFTDGGDVEYLNYNYTGSEATDVYAYSKATQGASIMAIKVTPLQSNNVTVGETGFATIGFPYATALPIGVTGYAVTAVSASGKVTTSEAIAAGTEIPANTGLIITAAPGNYTFTSVGAANAIGDNLLEAVGATAKTATVEAPIYVFAKLSASKVGFKKSTSGSLGANKAYLPGDVSTQSSLTLSFEDEATDINGVAEEASDAALVKVITSKGIQIGKYNVAGQQVK